MSAIALTLGAVALVMLALLLFVLADVVGQLRRIAIAIEAIKLRDYSQELAGIRNYLHNQSAHQKRIADEMQKPRMHHNNRAIERLFEGHK